jgi:truncated hemoglobin YjbI
MRARIAVATMILVVSAGLSAAADELQSIRIEIPRGGVGAFPIPGLEPWIVVRTQGSPQTPIQPKAAPEGKAPSRVLLRDELDKRIARIVYDAAVVGTDLWRRENYEGTFRLYQGTVAAVQPMLDHHPKLAAQALEALRRSANMQAAEGAFVLREAIDAIQKETAVALKPPPLWNRIGGEKTVRAVVKDLLAAVIKTKRVNLTRGTFKPEGKDLERLEQALVEAISTHTGGPLKPTAGMGLKEVLAGTKMTDGDFTWLQIELTAALEKNKVPDPERRELADVVRKLRPEIVEQ